MISYMKTFLLNIPKRLKLKSNEFDAKAILCDKAWTVFNDEGIKQLFIFQPDGSLFITIDGYVSNSMWKYIPVNNSVIITSGDKSMMFHPAFRDDVVLALERDGGSDCLLMIDEISQKTFIPKTLSELNHYFNQKEQQLLDRDRPKREVEEQRLREIEQQRNEEYRRLEKEQEDKRKQEREASKRMEDNLLRRKASDLKDSLRPKGGILVLFIDAFIIVVFSFLFDPIASFAEEISIHYLVVLLLFVVLGVCLFYLSASIRDKIDDSKQQENIDEWKKEHPDDPRNKYL